MIKLLADCLISEFLIVQFVWSAKVKGTERRGVQEDPKMETRKKERENKQDKIRD